MAQKLVSKLVHRRFSPSRAYKNATRKLTGADPLRNIHFLHIGKAAGSQVRRITDQINDKSGSVHIIMHRHDVYLKHLPKTEEYAFSIREPISRFRSGFYSRKRKGQPRLYMEWSAHDELAFSEFEHANDLAESLFADGALGAQAWGAMKSLRHTAHNQSDWFYCQGNFLRVRPPVWIIRQENFDADIREFVRRTKCQDIEFQITQDSVAAHRNDYSGVPDLSDKAKDNLRRWYAQDIEFVRMCNMWLQEQGG